MRLTLFVGLILIGTCINPERFKLFVDRLLLVVLLWALIGDLAEFHYHVTKK